MMWRAVVILTTALYLVPQIWSGTPFIIALPAALLLLSLVGDSGASFASPSGGAFANVFKGDEMKVKITRGYKGMPDGSNVGDEIEMDDNEFAEQRRLGNVERAQAQNAQAKQPTPGAGQPQDRPQANRSPTAVEPLTTDRFQGKPSNQDSDR